MNSDDHYEDIPGDIDVDSIKEWLNHYCNCPEGYYLFKCLICFFFNYLNKIYYQGVLKHGV